MNVNEGFVFEVMEGILLKVRTRPRALLGALGFLPLLFALLHVEAAIVDETEGTQALDAFVDARILP
jgi:hypothetical protein